MVAAGKTQTYTQTHKTDMLQSMHGIQKEVYGRLLGGGGTLIQQGSNSGKQYHRDGQSSGSQMGVREGSPGGT